MRRKNFFLGIIFVFLGAFFLLNNLNIIDFSVWNALFDLWPLFFVILGIHLISDRPIVTAISWILFFTVIILYAIYMQGGMSLDSFTINQLLNRHI